MLTLAGVSYRYAGGSTPSLHDLDLELADGQIVGLAGASESGKSTVCLVASGLAPRTIRGTLRGALLLDGVDVRDAPMHVLAASIGIGFQDPAAQLVAGGQVVLDDGDAGHAADYRVASSLPGVSVSSAARPEVARSAS